MNFNDDLMLSFRTTYQDEAGPGFAKTQAQLSAGSRSIQGSFASLGGALRALDTQGTFSRALSDFSMAESQVQNVVIQVQQMRSSFKEIGPAMLGSLGAITAVTAAVYFLNKEFEYWQKLKAEAEKQRDRSILTEETNGIIELYQANEALLNQYNELSAKERRTAQDEEDLLKIRRTMNENSDFKWSGAGKVDYTRYNEAVAASAQRLNEQFEKNNRTILENQRLLLTNAESSAKESWRRQIKDAQQANELIKSQFRQPEKAAKTGASAANEAKQQQEQISQIVLAAQRARMTEEEQLLSQYQESLAKIDGMKLAGVREREQAVYEVTVTYNDKQRALLGKQEEDWRASYERMKRYELDRWDEQVRLAEAKGPELLQRLKEINALREEEARRQFEHGQELAGIQTERRIFEIELNATIPEEQKSLLIEQVRLLAEEASLKANIQFKTVGGDLLGAAADMERLAFNQEKVAANQAKLNESNLTPYRQAVKNLGQMGKQAFGMLEGGLKSSIQAALLGQAEFGEAMKQMTAQVLASLAAEAAVKSIYELAEGFACLFVAPSKAAAHFQSAALYAAAAAAAGVGAMAMSGGGGGAGGGGGGGEGGTQYGPREYTSQDLAAIQAGGAAGGGGGEGKSAPVINVHNHISSLDGKDTAALFKRSGRQLAMIQVDQMRGNPDFAKMIGGLATRDY